MTDANGSAGADTIKFNIPTSDAGYVTGPPDYWSITTLSSLPTVTATVVIDGYSQPGAQRNTVPTPGMSNAVLKIEIRGDPLPSGSNLLGMSATGCRISGLVLNRSRSTIIHLSGSGSTGNTIDGNYIGTDITGTVDNGATTGYGIYITNASSNTVGGDDPGARNLISGNYHSGVVALSTYGTDNVIIGNYIGTDVTGTYAIPNDEGGVGLYSSNNTCGMPGAGNLISGNGNWGVRIGDNNPSTVQANLIGTDAAGTAALGNTGPGIYLARVNTSPNNNTIGGSGAGEGNVIAHNTGDGVDIERGNGNRILSNIIHSNGGLGIDLGSDGVTANDDGDPDTGANRLQNYPVLTIAYTSGTSTPIRGTLSSTPSTSFYLQFYANTAADPTGYGEGDTWLDSTTVTTDTEGDASFAVTVTPSVSVGAQVSATATNPNGNTSEFSACMTVLSALVVTNTNDSGAGSLREAIVNANGLAGLDSIFFDIPTSDPGYVPGPPSYWSIQPDSAFPVVSDTVLIDGYTQAWAQENTVVWPGALDAVLRIELDGTNAGSASHGLDITTGGCTICGLVINRFGSEGIRVTITGNNVIRGNFIGTDVTGTADLGNGDDGVAIFTGENAVGGSDPADRNLISGNTNHGVVLRYAAASNNVIKGNYIGVDVTGTSALGNGNRGIRLFQNPGNNTIGGIGTGEGNVIAFSGDDGIGIHSASGNAIRGNSIFSNSGLGIDLADDGVTVNDSADVDTGPNGLQNYPVLSSAYVVGTGTWVQGILNSTPSTAFTLDFYASSTADPTGFGEGTTWLGTTAVTTDVNGDAAFTSTLPGTATLGSYVAATATGPSGNTSEFSQCVIATNPFVVINTSDSGSGSLREAIAAANGIAGVDTITFDIPSSDPGYVVGPPAYWSITPASNLPATSEAVVIDGYSQAGAQPNTVAAPNTSDAVLTIELRGDGGASSRGLQISGGGSWIRGLVINRFPTHGIRMDSSGGNLIEGCYIGTDITGALDCGNSKRGIYILSSDNNTIGGITPDARNIIAGNNEEGLWFENAHSNAIVGNFIGVDVTGTAGRGNTQDGIMVVNSHNNTIGGTSVGARNIISDNGFMHAGIRLYINLSFGNVIQGNYIGTDVTGTAAIGNVSGVEIQGAPDNTIGGAAPGAGNVISGNIAQAIMLNGTTGNVVQGNYVGTNEALATNIGNGVAIDFQGGSPNDNLVGGTAPGEGNIIWYNSSPGVRVVNGQRNTIIGNSIFGNSDLGIELSNDGVTPNDAGDPDAGPNGMQNYPVLTSVVADESKTVIQGTLNSTPDSTFSLHFYYSSAADPTGYGEGQTFFADSSVTVDAMGDASFTLVFDGVTVPNGAYVTATATEPRGATSEFSQAVVSALMALTGQIVGADEQLQWTTVPPAAEYWVYGASNEAYFPPEVSSPYGYRVTVLPSGTTTWSTTTGVGDVNNNWTYLVIAVGGSGQELVRTNRIGEHDYALP